MSRIPVKKGTAIELLIGDEVVPAKVTQVLSTQLLCRTKPRSIERFYFLNDMGVTWRLKTSD